MFSISTVSTLALLLWTGLAAAAAVPRNLTERAPPGDTRTLVGWRSMNQDEFSKTYNNGGRLVYEGQYGGGVQLGDGVYTAMTSSSWVRPGDMVCAVLLDSTLFNSLVKVNIPQYAQIGGTCYNVWWNPGNVQTWTQGFNPAYNNAGTIRMSQIDLPNPPVVYQAVIGGGLVQAHSFEVECCPESDQQCLNFLTNRWGEAQYRSWNAHGGSPV